MKLLILLLIFFSPLYSFSQIDKIGYSKEQILDSMNSDPCKTSYNQIWYCSENGTLISYSFENNIVRRVLHMWEFKSKYEADEDVRKKVAKMKEINGKPVMKEDQAYWFADDLIVGILYGFTNGKHYSCWSVSKK
jgi:hypothetical protein